jgi:hypothetical protein
MDAKLLIKKRPSRFLKTSKVFGITFYSYSGAFPSAVEALFQPQSDFFEGAGRGDKWIPFSDSRVNISTPYILPISASCITEGCAFPLSILDNVFCEIPRLSATSC